MNKQSGGKDERLVICLTLYQKCEWSPFLKDPLFLPSMKPIGRRRLLAHSRLYPAGEIILLLSLSRLPRVGNFPPLKQRVMDEGRLI